LTIIEICFDKFNEFVPIINLPLVRLPGPLRDYPVKEDPWRNALYALYPRNIPDFFKDGFGYKCLASRANASDKSIFDSLF
jgi:hypothetical protein